MTEILIVLTVMTYTPGVTGEEKEALDQTRNALLTYPQVKKGIRHVEDFAIGFTGMSKEDLVYFSWAIPIATGRITTKPFKNFQYKNKEGWHLRPELEYNYNNKEFNSNLVYHWEF